MCQSWQPLKCFCSYIKLREWHGVIFLFSFLQAIQIMWPLQLYSNSVLWETGQLMSQFHLNALLWMLWKYIPGMCTCINCDGLKLSWFWIHCDHKLYTKDGINLLLWKVKSKRTFLLMQWHRDPLEASSKTPGSNPLTFIIKYSLNKSHKS